MSAKFQRTIGYILLMPAAIIALANLVHFLVIMLYYIALLIYALFVRIQGPESLVLQRTNRLDDFFTNILEHMGSVTTPIQALFDNKMYIAFVALSALIGIILIINNYTKK